MDGECKTKKCASNKEQLQSELKNNEYLETHTDETPYLYPTLDDPNFNIKIAQKKEFSDTKYDGEIYDVEKYADILATAEYELLPQQAFVRNFLSFQTPYNSLLLYHGLGSGKTCSAIGVCEEMRDYLKQMGINKKIIIIASPNVQDNFRLQLFDERRLKEVDGIWTIKGCLGNKLLKEINPTGMKGLTKEKVIQQVKGIINSYYSFQGYNQFSNEIVRRSGPAELTIAQKARNLENEFSNTLIVIDEVHNIRIADDNENKNVAKNLMFLVSVVSNVRLLLLSATPMFNTYKEIIWLLNLMNMNDRRGIISVTDIFDKNGNFKENGMELFIRKVTGYVSYVRGENPYTFPFRVYPDKFAPKHTFTSITEYPKYQINGKKIADKNKIQKLSLYLTAIGSYQKMGYAYIIDRLRNRGERMRTLKTGAQRKVHAFNDLNSFGYTDLLIPIESLNIIYPYPELDDLYSNIKPVHFSKEEEEEVSDLLVGELSEISEDENIVGGSTSSSLSSIPSSSSTSSSSTSSSSTSSSSTPTSSTSSSSTPTSSTSSSSSTDLESMPSTISSSSASASSSNKIYIDPKELTGIQGLKRVMNFIDKKTPPEKGHFEYKTGVPAIFSPKEIGKYSAKIKTVCDYIYNNETGKVSDGIIIIYSAYIDAGVIPMALALEEMGFTRYGDKVASLFKLPPTPVVDVRTFKEPSDKRNFKPARYTMITGDGRLSPDNDADLKVITSDGNLFKKNENGELIDISGEIIKVVIISQAGSEGLDFKGVRQVHILEPWYNINRIEQIIGRGVRNFSHKDLPFIKRNVQLFLYGTILENAEEEAADLYVYRMAELKAIKIGKVTRLLKQTAVDCIINHDQTELISSNFDKLEANRNKTQILSDHQVLKDFVIGDIDNSSTCDFMECEFKCLPDLDKYGNKEMGENVSTYNETYMLVNSDKIIQKVKSLMKMAFFYKKHDLIRYINIPKPYPTSQIYAALTQIIEDKTEYIVDKYGRTGYLINIGEYYMFQPSELNYKNISVHDRMVPIQYKHDKVKFIQSIKDKKDQEIGDNGEGLKIFKTMYENYNTAINTDKIPRGSDNWYHLCGSLIRKMVKEDNIIIADTELDRVELLKLFIIEHIVDTLMMDEKVNLLNFIYSDTFNGVKDEKQFYDKVHKYLLTKLVKGKGITGIVIFDGISRVSNFNIFVLNDNLWTKATPEDKLDLSNAILNKYKLKTNFNKYIGFIGFETNNKYMVYQVKDTTNTRSTGFRCDQAGKEKSIGIMNDIESNDRFSKATKESSKELCVRQELTLRSFQHSNLENKTWFVDTETAIINEFQKKEKLTK